MSDSLRPHGLQHARLPCPSHFLEFVQIHVYWVGDAIQPSHPLSPSSPFALNHTQHQRLFQWVSFSHQVAKLLELQLQYQSVQWIFRVDFFLDWVVWSPCSPRDSHESIKWQFFSSNNFSLHQKDCFTVFLDQCSELKCNKTSIHTHTSYPKWDSHKLSQYYVNPLGCCRKSSR